MLDEMCLIENIKNNQNVNESFQELSKLYMPVILSIISSQIELGGDFKIDRSDLIQEGLIGLHKAVLAYKFDNRKGAKFITFAYVVIKRRIFGFIKNANRVYSNERRSLDCMEFTESNKMMGTDRTFENPEKYVHYLQFYDDFKKYYRSLSKEQKLIFDLRDQGVSYEVIAERIGCNKKRVDNQIQKMRRDFEIIYGVKSKKGRSKK